MDPTLLQALISGGGAVLGGLLGSAGAYLIAKKKLRQDASLHLYQKQLEACSEIFHEAQQLIDDLGSGSRSYRERDERFWEFFSLVQKTQFCLPSEVIPPLQRFCDHCEDSIIPTDDHRFYYLFRIEAGIRLARLVNIARRNLDVAPLGAELIAVKQPEKNQSQHESPGQVERVG